MNKLTRVCIAAASVFLLVQMSGCGGVDEGAAKPGTGDSAGGKGSTTTATKYTIGGSVEGLAVGTSVVLQNNDSDKKSVNVAGEFIFDKPLADSSAYAVTVLTQPANQICDVGSGSGYLSGQDVKTISVKCVPAHSVGGNLSGLVSGKNLVLQNNGGDDLALSADGGFTFATQLKKSAAYDIKVSTSPQDQSCEVVNGKGNISESNITTVAVTCKILKGPPELRLTFDVKQLKFSWPEHAKAAYYLLFEDKDGKSGFKQAGGKLYGLSTGFDIAAVHRYDWLNARYILKACNDDGCFESSPQIGVIDAMTKVIGYFKAANTGATDHFGWSIALSSDGKTLAVGAPYEDGKRSGILGIDSGISTPTDNDVSNAGAVYVFARTNGKWVQQAYIKSSNTKADDLFGASVTLSGDGKTLAVGAMYEDGGATGVNGDSIDKCGASPPANCALNSGAVYVYSRSDTTWAQQAYIKASNPEQGDSFGSKVVLNAAGDTLAVGAIYEDGNGVNGNQADNSAPNSGAVYVFISTPAGAKPWVQQAYIKASNAGGGDAFGGALALSGDGNTLAVGAAYEDSNGTNETDNSLLNSGAAYVFARTGSNWSQQVFLKAPNLDEEDGFGGSLALSGDGNMLAVGAPYEDSKAKGVNPDTLKADNSAPNSGAVYVLNRVGVSWAQTPIYLKASNTGAGDGFGQAVAFSDDGSTLAIGAAYEGSATVGVYGDQNNNDAVTAGAVYVFTRPGNDWLQQAYVKASVTTSGDYFGKAVALSQDGNTLAVGADGDDANATGINGARSSTATPTSTPAAVDSGAVYLY